MNYGKNDVNNKIRSIKSRKSRISTKLSVNAFRIFLLIVLGFVVTCGFAGFGVLNGIVASAPSIDNVSVIPEGYVSRFFYTDGTVSQTLIGAGGNREYISIEELPAHVYNAFVASEDERFWEHDGIDARSIIRAAREAIASGDLGSGGSTITQQLLKNQVFGGGNEENRIQKLVRKIQEQYLAIQLESRTPKKTILEYYINTINMGQGSWGLEMAATTYFGKSASLLTVSEAACLACIAQSPVRMNPYTEPENNRDRRDRALTKMLECEFITQTEYDEALADTDALYQRIHDYVEANSGKSFYSYFTDEVISELMTELMAKGYTSSQASDMIYTGGIQVYTTQDHELQSIVDSVVNDESYWPAIGTKGSYYDITYALSVQKEDGTTIHYQLGDLIKFNNSFENTYRADVKIYGGVYELFTYDTEFIENCIEEFREAKVEEGDIILGERYSAVLEPQISFVLLDNSTGAVRALCGGRGDKEGNRVLDRATDSARSVGSTFKVVAAYLPAFDTGVLTLGDTLDDSPYFYPGTTKEVSNWYASGYKGLKSTRYAISYSMNILACRAIEAVTPKVSFDYLQKLGFTTLVEYEIGKDGRGYTDIGVPLALGGLTKGVTNIELTAAYASIANGGVYNEPYYFTKVLDHAGNVILEHKSQPTQVMKTSTAYLLTSAMQDTLDPNLGTAGVARFLNYRMSLAGKSGTTTDNFDLWFEGFSPYYTAGVWEGYDIPSYIYTTNTHEIIWRDIMERIHEHKELPYVEFTKPETIITAEICTQCGKLAIPGICDKYAASNAVRTEYFAKGTEPTDYCDCHRKVLICRKTGLLAQAGCSETYERVLLIKDEPEIWTPVDTDYSTLSPTPTPPGFVRPTATPAGNVSLLPTPTLAATPTPTPEPVVIYDADGNPIVDEHPDLLAWFAELYNELMSKLLGSKETEDFYTENYTVLNDLCLALTPTPSAQPTYIAQKKQVNYSTGDTHYILHEEYCYECSVKAGLIKPTGTPEPSPSPTGTPSPTPTMTPDEFREFLTGIELILNPPSPTPIPWDGPYEFEDDYDDPDDTPRIPPDHDEDPGDTPWTPPDYDEDPGDTPWTPPDHDEDPGDVPWVPPDGNDETDEPESDNPESSAGNADGGNNLYEDEDGWLG